MYSKSKYEFTGTATANSKITVAFCNPLGDTDLCSTGDKTMAKTESTTEVCKKLSGPNPTDDSDFSVLDSDNNDGLKITYKNGDACVADTSRTYEFHIEITCDSSVETIGDYTVVDGFETGGDSCVKRVSFKHKVGCKNDTLSGLWEWFNNNKWVMFAVFLILGTVICFLGRTLFKPVLFISGMLVAIFLVWLIFYSTFLSNNTKTWVGWVVLIGSILLGLLIGAIFVKIAKLGAFVLAAWGGFSVGLLIYNAFLYKMDS